ncbi:MAG TPA: hypothetical protein HPP87_04635 [Planctomycetes bacterium]|nr:hypothetical protein [Planctomycetota bacterium]HIJ70634.1 hypothetical protein [Planctomycetota bacterium]
MIRVFAKLVIAFFHGLWAILVPGEYEKETAAASGGKPVWAIEEHLLGIFIGIICWALIVWIFL